MKVWLVTIGEPLPIDEGSPRLLRHGLLAETLRARGHDVLWWTSNFDHAAKRHRFPTSATVQPTDYMTIRLLRGPGYPTNRSLKRFVDHYVLARRFRKEARNAEAPDMIVASFPPVELAYEAVRYGATNGVPVFVDLRDPWPHIFLDMVPRWLRWPARAALAPLYRRAVMAFRDCSGMLGITDEIVAWAGNVAGRSPGRHDRAFAMGYSDRLLPSGALREATQFWDSLSVRDGDRAFNVCYFGAMGQHFDLDTVFDAARRLRERNSPIRFILCGPRANLERRLAAIADSANVILPGWVDAPRIQTLMARSQAGLAPYRSSWNFRIVIPNKIFEYMAGKLPIVSSLEGASADLLREADCGLMYRNGDPGSLIEAVEELRGDPKRRLAMAAKARDCFEESFTAERVYRAMAEFLEEAAGFEIERRD